MINLKDTINLKQLSRHEKFTIVFGIFLLIFAFLILMTSGSNADSDTAGYMVNASQDKNTGSAADADIPESTAANSIFKEEVPESITANTIPEIPAENTSKNDTETDTDMAENNFSQKNQYTGLTKKQLKKLIDFDAEYPYLIRVNLDENFAVVYAMDKHGRHSIPYKAFICSTGLEKGDTPTGLFEMSDKYRWRLMVDGTYAQYAIRLKGQIMLHSVPYTEASSDTLEYWEYNKLGQPASLGCVRFQASAIQWIYENCNAGTKVEIYSKPGEASPIEIPKLKKIKKNSPNSGWDPTDKAEGNPWKKKI